jgi:hypothetical protein
MALGKPTIIVTQDSTSLPFDIHDMQCLQYERQRLNRTLDEPLRRMVVDTLSVARTGPDVTGQQEAIALVGDLRTEMTRLKAMVADVVGAWQQGPVAAAEDDTTAHDLARLEGAWLNEESQTYLYARMIGDDLLVPFCFRGNATLNGFYYSWRRAGDYWFSRYAWIDDDGVSGFAFLRHESVDVLKGAWWYGRQEVLPASRPQTSGIASTWRRIAVDHYPGWATRFFEDHARHLAAAAKDKGPERLSPPRPLA